MKKSFYPLVIAPIFISLLAFSLALPPRAAAQPVSKFKVDCEASLRAYKEQGITSCTCQNGVVFCPPPSGGQSSGKTLSTKQQIKQQVFGTALESLLNSSSNDEAKKKEAAYQQAVLQQAAAEKAAALAAQQAEEKATKDAATQADLKKMMQSFKSLDGNQNASFKSASNSDLGFKPLDSHPTAFFGSPASVSLGNDPNVVDLSGKKGIVDPKDIQGATQPPVPSATQPPVPKPMKTEALVNSINDRAKRLGWSKEKLDHLNKALSNLHLGFLEGIILETHTADARIMGRVDLIDVLNKISSYPKYNIPKQGHKGEKSEDDINKPLLKGKPPLDRDLASVNCQTFFRALGEELASRGIESWNDRFPLAGVGKERADKIVAEIDKISQQSQGKWGKLSDWKEAQDIADRGGVVIGGLRARMVEGKEHAGHLEVVVPIPPEVKQDIMPHESLGNGPSKKGLQFPGNGPFVRDGNERLILIQDDKGHLVPVVDANGKPVVDANGKPVYEKKYYLGTYGAVRASKTMSPHDLEREVGWYLWVPTKPSK